jgi:hypothetical protein
MFAQGWLRDESFWIKFGWVGKYIRIMMKFPNIQKYCGLEKSKYPWFLILFGISYSPTHIISGEAYNT